MLITLVMKKDGNTHHKGWEKHYRKLVHIIVIKPYSVFVCESEFSMSHPGAGQYENTSNHDSCWREGVELFGHVMKGYDFCYGDMQTKHKPAPVAAVIRTSPTIFTKPIQAVKCATTRLDDGYHKKLVSLDYIDLVDILR